MRVVNQRARLILAASALGIAAAAQAGETVTYSYDALGRLTATTSTGTVNNGAASALSYDPAGNRTHYDVSGAAGSAPPPGAQPSSASPASGAEDAAVPAGTCVAAAGDAAATGEPAGTDTPTGAPAAAPAAEPCG
jgi:hypothetical protein